MSKKSWLSVCVVAGSVCIAAAAVSQDAAGSKRAAAQDGADAHSAEMMQAWLSAATPGENHKRLAPLVGSWQTRTRTWPQGLSSPPMDSTGTSQKRWVLEGRFILEEATGTLMGMPFSGLGLTGYDNFGDRIVSTWADTMGTSIYVAEGAFDESGKVASEIGRMNDPTTGAYGKFTKYVTRIINNDKHVLEFYDLGRGEREVKVCEITYTRAK